MQSEEVEGNSLPKYDAPMDEKPYIPSPGASANDFVNNETMTALPVEKSWVKKLNFGLISLVSAVLFYAAIFPALLGNLELFFIIFPIMVFTVSFIAGIVGIVTYKKSANRKATLWMSVIGLCLTIGSPVIGLVGLFLFMSIGLMFFS